MNTQETLLTKREAARVLQITSGQLARMVNRGEVPSVRLPNREVRFCEADLWRWIESHKQEGGTDDR